MDKFLIAIILWLMAYGMFSGLLYFLMWAFSYEDMFSWKMALGAMFVWVIVVRLAKLAGGAKI